MEKLFSKFKKNWDLKQEIAAFKKYLKNPDWIIIPKTVNKRQRLKNAELIESVKKTAGNRKQFKKDLIRISRCIERSCARKAMLKFRYGDNAHGLCYPLFSEGKVFGIIALCGLKKEMSPDLERIFSAFTDTVVRESQKEKELEDANDSIRPRAVALSTVHTVHRLVTLSLNINELLPRIARLSLQILRANRCSIKLVDRKKKILIPKVTIDLRREKAKLKKVQIGKYAPGKAVKKGAPVRGGNYIAVPMIEEEVIGVITLYDKLDGKEFTQFDEEIMKTLCEQSVIAIKNAQLFKEQEDLTLSSIKCIAHLLENRPHGSYRAEGSFLKLISIIGNKLGMNEREIKMLQYAAMLHDAGQISVPERVLMKQGELTGWEYDMVKMHPLKGASILSKFKPLKPIVPIIMYHHENYDGTGYPKGLKGSEIPLAARILAVVGAFEAMITEKPYRQALSIPAAVKEVSKNSSVQFDPEVVKVFCESVERKDVRRLLEKELREK